MATVPKGDDFSEWGLPPHVAPTNPFGIPIPDTPPDEDMQRVLAEWLGEKPAPAQVETPAPAAAPPPVALKEGNQDDMISTFVKRGYAGVSEFLNDPGRKMRAGIGFADVPHHLPGDAEVRAAREAGFGSERGLEAWTTPNTVGRSIKGSPSAVLNSENPLLSVPNTGHSQDTANDVMRTALMANRAPLAALGFEPRQMIWNESDRAIRGIMGMFSPKGDYIYADEVGSTGTGSGFHETVHRGLNELRQAGSKTAQKVDRITEEAIARYFEQMMLGPSAWMDEPAKRQGREVWEKIPNFSEIIGKLNSEAAALMAQRKPRGPR